MECERKNKWWRGCKFEPRYDEKFPPDVEAERVSVAFVQALKTKTYVADVCVTCGKVIKRGDLR